MSITYNPVPGYAVSYPIVGVNHDFPMLWLGGTQQISFQCQWTSGLTTGTLEIMGSNQDLPQLGNPSDVKYPPPLTPVALLTIDISTSPYSTNLAAILEVETSVAWVWLRYTGAASGSLSVAVCSKSNG